MAGMVEVVLGASMEEEEGPCMAATEVSMPEIAALGIVYTRWPLQWGVLWLPWRAYGGTRAAARAVVHQHG